MEFVRINGKENILDAYGVRPTLPYDIEGILVEKEGKSVKVETEIDSDKVLYSLRLKEEIDEEVGEKVYIEKENIVATKIETGEEKKESKEEIRKIEKVVEKIGMEKNEENLKAAKILESHDIPVTEENINSFLLSNKYLGEIVDNMDYDSATKLLKQDIDIEEESLQKIAESINGIKGEEDFSLMKFLRMKKGLSYKDAEKIAVKIYGRTMGKDIYDSIIALHREGIDITKENIEKVKEVIHKLHDLKNLNSEAYIKLLKEQLSPNIENLYKMKYSYSEEDINFNWSSELYEQFTIRKETTKEDLSNILMNIGLEDTDENILLLRQFMIYELDIKKENFEKIDEMKRDLKELTKVLNEERTALLLKEGIDPLRENIEDLLLKLKSEDNEESLGFDQKDVEEILEKLDTLGEIEDKDLILLLKSGKDFKLETLKEIQVTNNTINEDTNYKTVEKTITLSNILNTLEDLKTDTISFAVKRFSTITLNDLYNSEVHLSTDLEEVVVPIEKTEENLIRQEYLKLKNSLTLNLVKESVEEGLNIEYMPLDEVNNYINKKVNRYKEVENIVKGVKYLRGMEEELIPIAMKNQLNMSIKDLEKVYLFNRNKKGLGTLMNDLAKNGQTISNEGMKETVEMLEKKSKSLSEAIKKGDEDTKDYYKDLIETFVDLENSFNSKNSDEYRKLKDEIDKSLRSMNTVSENDLVLKFPIHMNGTFENLQVIIPDFKEGIDENHMVFYLNIDTSNLGNLKFGLEVLGKDVYVKFDTEEESHLLNQKYLLEEKLNKIGYNLKSFSAKEYEDKKDDEYLKIVDTRV